MIGGIAYPVSPAPLFPRPSITRPGRQRKPKGELVPLVEPSGLVYGQATRDWCHSGSKALHPVVHLHIIDRFGAIYLQKRSVIKDLFPGCWDTAVGGHVGYGESVEETLFREAAEELGLHAFTPNQLDTYVWESDRERELVFVYAMVGHPEIHPDHGEVATGRWWKCPDLETSMGRGTLTPNFEYEFARIRERLFAML